MMASPNDGRDTGIVVSHAPGSGITPTQLADLHDRLDRVQSEVDLLLALETVARALIDTPDQRTVFGIAIVPTSLLDGVSAVLDQLDTGRET